MKIPEGVLWAAGQIKGSRVEGDKIFLGGKRVVLVNTKKQERTDNFNVKHKKGIIEISGMTLRSHIYGLLELAGQSEKGEIRDLDRNFPFKTRNYKHEINFGDNKFGDGSGRASIRFYTKNFWESLCQELVKRSFSGLVFYQSYHPFPYLIDYKKFPEAAFLSKDEVKANRKAFNLALSTAKKYGLRTFIQNYVTHFPESFARYHKLPFFTESGRLSTLGEKVVIDYSKYCYSELFKACPDLTGLYMNFESANNAYDFVEEAVLPVCNKMTRKPVLVFRMWDSNAPERVAKIIKLYKGEAIIGHKMPDSSDAYYYPNADSRVVEWKKHIGKTEFMFLFGPCHNSGTNITNVLWSDPEFVYKTLTDAKRKGADSISFHSVAELLSNKVSDNGVISEEHRTLALVNYFHMDTVARFFRNEPFDKAKWAEYYREHFGLKEKQAGPFYEALAKSSSIIPAIFRQFFRTSAAEGYQHIPDWNHIQDLFFNYPCSFQNDQYKQDMQVRTAWINKKMKFNVCPDDYQWIIDYVNPGKKKTKENPFVIAENLRKNAVSSLKVIKNTFAGSKDKKNKKIIPLALLNTSIGLSVSEEIKAGIAFYRCYFARSKKEFIRTYSEGISHLLSYKKIAGERKKFKKKFIRSMFEFKMEENIDEYIENHRGVLANIERVNFPFGAFKKYVDSRLAFHEIRKKLRPSQIHSPASLLYAENCLKSSMAKANSCLKALDAKPELEAFSKNVKNWISYLEYELARVGGVSLAAGESKFLGLDNCFRYGEHFQEDFNSFFLPYDYRKEDRINFTVLKGKSGLVIKINQFDCDTRALEETWEKATGGVEESWFLKILIDPGTNKRNTMLLDFAPKGRFVLSQNIEYRHRQYLVRTLPVVEKNTKVSYCGEAFSWNMEIEIPYKLLKRTPRKNEKWGFNMISNPGFKGQKNNIWRPCYESYEYGNPLLMGEIKF